MRGSAKLFLMVLMIALSACYSSRHGSIAPLMSGSPAMPLDLLADDDEQATTGSKKN